MKQRIARFMAGRNGNDQLNIFLLVLAVVFIILGFVFRNSLAFFFNMLTLLAVILVYVRMFSRNISRRRAENARFMETKYKILSRVRLQREKWTQRDEYKFFLCPSCRTVLRVPRGRGKIMIVCRKCGTRFERKS